MASAEAVREVETASMNDIIDLNVGGTKFQTTRYLWLIKKFNGQCSLLLFPGRHCCTILILCWRECLTPCLPFVQVKSITRNLLLSLFLLSHNCSAYDTLGLICICSGVRRDGAYFLDRDPIHFRPVLNYLRSGQLTLDR